MKFAKAEYSSKKPLALRVIQLKPQTTFQKGSVLPNLLIKSLQNTAFVVYLDYGDEVRFYFFSHAGQSMGASTFPKSEKMLAEMHGKGNTLLKLPKPDPTAGLDLESMYISDEFNKNALRIGHKYQVNLTNMPPIAVTHQDTVSFKNNSVRIGVIPSSQSLHFNSAYVKTESQNLILLREIFLLMHNLQPNNDSHLMVSTIWAILEEKKNTTPLLLALKKGALTNPLISKGLEWIEKVLFSYLSSKTEIQIDLAKNYSEIIKNLCKMDKQLQILLIEISILWIMSKGLQIVEKFSNLQNIPIQYSYLVVELLEFYLSRLDLIQKYHIAIPDQQTLQMVWMKYCCHFYILKSYGQIEWEKPLFIPQSKNEDLNDISDGFQKGKVIFDLLQRMNLLEFLDIVPDSLKIALEIDLIDMIHAIFLHRGLKRVFPIEVEVATNHQKIVEFSAENLSNWILSECSFKVWSDVDTRVQVGFVETPRITNFDKKMDVQIRLSGLKPGKAKIGLLCEYKIHSLNEKRINIELAQISVKIV